MLQFTLPPFDYAAHIHPQLQGWAPKSSNWKIKSKTFDFLWITFSLSSLFFFSQLLCFICLRYHFWAVRLLFPQCQHWGVRWWRGDSNPLGDPRLLLANRSDMVTAGHFLALLVLVTNWRRKSSQVKKRIWTIYYTLCFSIYCSPLPSPLFLPFSVPVLLTSPSSGEDDGITERNALCGRCSRDKG